MAFPLSTRIGEPWSWKVNYKHIFDCKILYLAFESLQIIFVVIHPSLIKPLMLLRS